LIAWLQYSINDCHRLSDRGVECNGVFENVGQSDRILNTFVFRLSVNRNPFMARHGNVAAVDNNANIYQGIRISVANKANNDDGQFGFILTPRLPTPFRIYFDNVESQASTFVRIRIPIIEASIPDAPLIEPIFVNVPIK
jgi:hypothetical protein